MTPKLLDFLAGKISDFETKATNVSWGHSILRDVKLNCFKIIRNEDFKKSFAKKVG